MNAGEFRIARISEHKLVQIARMTGCGAMCSEMFRVRLACSKEGDIWETISVSDFETDLGRNDIGSGIQKG